MPKYNSDFFTKLEKRLSVAHDTKYDINYFTKLEQRIKNNERHIIKYNNIPIIKYKTLNYKVIYKICIDIINEYNYYKYYNEYNELYKQLISGYSKSYLSGSKWYYGDNLPKIYTSPISRRYNSLKSHIFFVFLMNAYIKLL